MIFGNSNFLEDMDEFFKFSVNPIWKNTYTDYKYTPYIVKNDGTLEIEIPLPGYEKEDISIDIEDSILNISSDGNKSNSFAESFSRSFELLDGVDQSSCQATMKAGILKIEFKQILEKDSKKINVKID